MNFSFSLTVVRYVSSLFAKAFPSATVELVRKIVWFKLNTRFGCRRISNKLNGEVGKDTVQKIRKKYQSSKSQSLQVDIDKPSVLEAIKEEVAYLQRRVERLERDNIFLCLKVEKGSLIAKVAEQEMSKISLETFQLFKQYCKQESLGTLAAVRKIGLTASHYLDVRPFRES